MNREIAMDDIDFYSLRGSKDGDKSLLPPLTGWSTCCGSSSPAPQIRLLTNDEIKRDDLSSISDRW